jgi:hypothetical protein
VLAIGVICYLPFMSTDYAYTNGGEHQGAMSADLIAKRVAICGHDAGTAARQRQ